MKIHTKKGDFQEKAYKLVYVLLNDMFDIRSPADSTIEARHITMQKKRHEMVWHGGIRFAATGYLLNVFCLYPIIVEAVPKYQILELQP